jgi:hypothetical protein
MREFEINLVPFNIINDEVTVYFSKVEKVNYCRLFKNDLPKNMPINISNNLDQFIWWTSKQNNEDTEIVVKLGENRRFAKHYFNLLLYEHFFAQNMLINRNFIKDTEIYLEDFSFPKKEYKKYNKFTLRIDNNDLIEGTSLLLSYDGDSFMIKMLKNYRLILRT